MLLAIDCGNTNTVIALFDALDKKAEWRMATDSKRTADDHMVWLNHHLTKSGFDESVVSDMVVSSVVPSCVRSFEGLAAQLNAAYFIIDPAECNHGVGIDIPDPKQAGADRLANTKGAEDYPLPAMVIDFGTATTFDLVNSDGHYIGGVIAPGVHLSITALHQAAARLPLIEADKWSPSLPIFGTDTVGAMNAGLYYGYICLVEGMIARLKAAYGQKMTVITTGGLSHIFSTMINGIDHHDPDLTIKGMVKIYAQQQRN